jgi:hypothetical protein
MPILAPKLYRRLAHTSGIASGPTAKKAITTAPVD